MAEQWYVRYLDGGLNRATDEATARRWERESAKYPERFRCTAAVRREPGGPVLDSPAAVTDPAGFPDIDALLDLLEQADLATADASGTHSGRGVVTTDQVRRALLGHTTTDTAQEGR